MQLKKVDMYGFKSFADRTEIIFDPGLTGIVGPNGCGKSNVVDCIKWCLGSMSAKSLRGNEMLDVIFGGTEKRPSMGMAEVSLTFTNERGLLPVDYQEVTITRRLYRSGESEYLLNKQPCRLRDIRELFMDTGVGVESYAIIEQGKIDLLLQAGPKERRMVFEEAAGISKFKARKKEAESKLERVSQDLLRIGDVLKELISRVRSLKIQAGRAEKYRVMSDEVKSKKKILTLHCFGELVAQRAELARQVQEVQVAHAAAAGELEGLRARVGGLRTREQEADRQLQSRRGELAAKDGLIAQTEDRIESDARHVEELGRMLAKRREELESARGRAVEARGREERTRVDLAQVNEEIGIVDRQLGELQQDYLALDADGRAIAEKIEAAKSDALDLVHRQARHQNERSGAAAELRNVAARLERVLQRRRQIAEEIDALSARRRERVAERDQIACEIEATKAEFAAGQVELKEVEKNLNALRERVAALRERETSLASRHELLADLEKHYEGLQQGVVRVLEGIAAGEPRLEGVRGVLADAIRVERAHIPIVDAVLEGREDVLLAETLACARRAVEYARETAGARVSAVALDQVRVPDWYGAGVEEIPGVLGRASQFVTADPGDEKLVELLFGDTLVVENLDVALALLADYQVTFPMVTRAGERVDPKGVLSGGATAEAMTLLSRKAEMRDLEREIMDVRLELQQADEEKKGVFEWMQTAEQRAQHLRTTAYEKTTLAGEKKNEVEALDRKCAVLAQEEEVSCTEQLDMENQVADLNERDRAAREALEQAIARAAEVEAALKELEAARAEQDARRTAAFGRITELKIGLAQSRENRKHLEEGQRRLEREIVDLENLVRTTEEIIADTDEKVERIERENAERGGQLVTLRADREALGAAVETLGAELEALRVQGLEALASEQETARVLREKDEQLNSARVEEAELKGQVEAIVENTRENLGFDLEADHAAYVDDPQCDWDALTQEIKDLSEALGKIGNVNLSAIDELAEAEQRAEYLATQEKDLTDSKNQLEELIKKIKRDSRDLFLDTVEKVRVNFGLLFRKLFGGGKADILLEENVDILEAGIEIMARPPGKELTSIRLLSGGEKALTALALIMGIFMLKPSPFCVLDEVDAPLDEQNVHRFLALINEFAKETQFLLITHNKVSMSATDVIYGITMEEKGVSKKVSMKLVEEQVPALV